ncbi:MAG TPA: hypothetical protein VHA52_07985, partial [Candidatus Babeliaceae bacterium]|nr:hypothetical protein [Candidatus Babeliaceae bacterium]
VLNDPLLIELHEHPAMQRLKHIRHYGADYYAFAPYDYTRYGHSVGVAHIVALTGGSREEIAAALYHDVSHPCFSHAAEKLLTKITRQPCRTFDYQDSIHETFLNHYNILEILKKYGLTLDAISPKNRAFTRLEQPLPDLCADRIEYTLSSAFHAGLITKSDIKEILESLHYDNGIWYFDSQLMATKFAYLSLYLTRHAWASPEGQIVDSWLSQALERALELEIITLDDIHYSIDETVWKTLKAQTDPVIQNAIYSIEHCFECFTLGTEQNYQLRLWGKFRGTNPLIFTKNGFSRLLDLDPKFKQDYISMKSSIEAGWYYKATSQPQSSEKEL